MKNIASLTGPAAAGIALKCPFCLLAFAGIGAGVGSFAPIRGLYAGLILALGGTFLWFLFRKWKSSALSGWIVGLGLVGFGSLVWQAAAETSGIISFLPMSAMSAASIASFFSRKSAPCDGCRARRKPDKNEDKKKGLNLPPGESVTLAHKEKTKMAKRKVEVFTAGCPVCEPAVELVKKIACPSCDVVVYDLSAGGATEERHAKAARYGVTRVPAVVVDGALLECCKTGPVTEKELRAAGVGSA